MTRSVKRLYLPYSEWPRDVKARWKKAFEPNTDLFHEGGPGAHLSDRTVQQLHMHAENFSFFYQLNTRICFSELPLDG